MVATHGCAVMQDRGLISRFFQQTKNVGTGFNQDLTNLRIRNTSFPPCSLNCAASASASPWQI